MCNWCHKAYIKIILFGTIAIAGISSIYSVLANVENLQIAPNSQYSFVIDGISCNKPGDTLSLFSGKECYNTAKQMSQNKSLNDEWQCNLYTDYSSNTKNLYEDIFVFQFLFIILVISSFMYGINACIHDCTLIHYSSLDQLDSVKFHPQKKDMLITWKGVQFAQYCNNYLKNHCHLIIRIALMLIIIIFLCITGGLFFFLIDVILIPIVYLVLGIAEFFAGLFNIGNCKLAEYEDNYINGICYVSSSFVALSRCLIMTSSVIMISNALGIFGGFGGQSIPSIDAENCSCECVFVLPQTNLWGFVIATSIIMITNFFFITKWRQEAYHGQHFLYLITYSLSIKIAQNLNPINPAGDVVDKPFTSKYTLEINKQDEDDNDAEHSDLELYNRQLGSQYSIDLKTTQQVNQEKQDWIHNSTTSQKSGSQINVHEMNTYYPLNSNQGTDKQDIDMNRKTAIAFRWIMWLYSMVASIGFIGLTAARLGKNNPYGYRLWICKFLQISGYGFLGIATFALIFYGIGVYRKKR